MFVASATITITSNLSEALLRIVLQATSSSIDFGNKL